MEPDRVQGGVNRAAELLAAPTGALQVPAEAPHAPNGIRLSLIVPTFNEAGNVAELTRRLAGILDARLPDAYEIIIVDDDSPDKTWEIAQGLTGQYSQVRVMRREHQRGLSSAVIRGWQAARGEVLGVIDGDLQHPPETVAELWNEIERGADLATASRHVEGGGVSDWSMMRRLMSRGAQLIGLLILPGVLGRLSDPMSGYFMVRRKAIAGVTLAPLGYKILIEVVGRGSVRWIGEVGYVFRERTEGKSKVTWHQSVEYLAHLAKLRLATLPVSRFLRFALVGFSGVFVDMGLLFLFSDPKMLAWGLTSSKLVAAELAILNNFLWNDAWTFRDLASDQKSFRQKLRRFIKFNIICTMGLAINVALLNIQFNQFGMNRYLANGVAILVVTAWNFWLNLKLSWRTSDTPKTEPA